MTRALGRPAYAASQRPAQPLYGRLALLVGVGVVAAAAPPALHAAGLFDTPRRPLDEIAPHSADEAPRKGPDEAPRKGPEAVAEEVPAEEEAPAAKATSSNASMRGGYKEYKYVVVGGGTAAYNALQRLQKKDPHASVLWVCEEDAAAYSRPPLSKELWQPGADAERLAFTDWRGKAASVFYPETDMERLDVVRGVRATRLHPDYKAVFLSDGELVFFDKCLLATGAAPRTLDEGVAFNARDGVSTFRTVADFADLSQRARGAGQHITVLGGGFLGAELAAGLAQRARDGVRVTLVFPEEGLLPRVLPSYLAARLRAHFEDAGIEVRAGEMVARIDRDGARLRVRTQGGGELATDHVVFCGGVAPRGDVAAASGLETDADGAIVANSELQTSRSDVYAAGDAATFYDATLRARRRVEHYNHAALSGATAAENMSGGRATLQQQSTFWSDLPKVGIEAVGLTDPGLETVGVWVGEGEFDKGLVYYLRDDVVVGVLAWNAHGKMDEAKKILQRRKKVHNRDDLKGWISMN